MREENSTLGSLGGSSRSGLQSAGVDGDGGTNNSATSSMHMRGENSTCSSSFANELSLPSSFASSTNGSSASRGGAGTTAVISDIHDNDSDSLVTRQLPSSQDGDSGRLEVYDNGQGQVSLTGGGDTTVTSAEGSEANSEDQLALRISKETKPMMHLLRLLKDIDDRNGNEHADPKSKAVASLISDFEQEVSLIEHRMKDENLIMNGEHPPLPPNWIALEDPDSGDVYFANEATGKFLLCGMLDYWDMRLCVLDCNVHIKVFLAMGLCFFLLTDSYMFLLQWSTLGLHFWHPILRCTGETQWERPGLISELKERLQEMNSSAMSHDSLMKPSNMRTNTFDNNNDGGSMQGSNRSNDFRNNSNRSNNYEQQQQQLQGSNMSNNYEQRGGGGADMNSSNASNNFDGSQGNMSNTYNTSNTSNNHHKQQQQQQDKNNMRSSNLSNNFEKFEGSHSNMTNTLESSLTDSHKSGAFNNDLPPDWIALEDPDSGETYYANEVSGESTWDKPPMPQSLLPQETQQSVGSGSAVNDDDEGDDDDDLPPDWIALEDADSGDTYYLNQVTMATTWDRPGTKGNNASVNKADVGENDESSSHLQQSENDIASNQGDLPPGWESILDPSSGDHYYAHESGETQWERPEFTESALLLLSEGEDDDTTSNQQHQQQGPSLGNNTDGDTHDVSTHDDDDRLPHGWFEAIDEDSGDKYYCNEVTGEL